MGVTYIKYLCNCSSEPIVFVNTEVGHEITVNPRKGVDPGKDNAWNQRIPWAGDGREFEKHHIKIQVDIRNGSARDFYIWQSCESDGDKVRSSTDGYHELAPGVRDVSDVDGSRILVVDNAGFWIDRIE